MKCSGLRICLVALTVFSLLVALTPSSTFAQGSTRGATMGKIYLSASDAGYVSNVNVTPFVPFHVYLLVELDYGDIGRPELNGEVAMWAYEAGVDIPGIGVDVVVASSVIRNQVLSVGTDTNLIIATQPPIVADTMPTWIVNYSMLVLNPAFVSDLLITVGPSSPSSFNGLEPGFAENIDVGECVIIASGTPTKCIRPFALVGDLSLNCVNECIDETPIPVEPSSWSRIKASFVR